MTIDIAKLKAAALAAGGEEWRAFICTASKTYSVHTPDDERRSDVVNWPGFDGQKKAAAKARFIAAANPAAVLELIAALEAKDAQIAERDGALEREREKSRRMASRIAELERERAALRPVGVMSEAAFHRLENSKCRFIALFPRPGIYLPRKRPADGVIVYARTATSINLETGGE